MKKILQKEEKVLREIDKEVPINEIPTLKIQKILKDNFIQYLVVKLLILLDLQIGYMEICLQQKKEMLSHWFRII